MSAKSAIAAILLADAELMTLLPGGVHYEASEVSLQRTPAAFDEATLELLPCVLIKREGTFAPAGVSYATEDVYAVWAYHRTDDEAILSVLDRIYMLLHRRNLGQGFWELRFTGEVTGNEDDVLMARVGVSRYQAPRKR